MKDLSTLIVTGFNLSNLSRNVAYPAEALLKLAAWLGEKASNQPKAPRQMRLF